MYSLFSMNQVAYNFDTVFTYLENINKSNENCIVCENWTVNANYQLEDLLYMSLGP